MASVEKRGARYVARWRDADGRQRAKTFDRKRDASAFLERVGSALQAGVYVDPKAGRITVGDFSEKWLETLGHLKPTTRASYVSTLEVHVLPRWGSTPLNRVEHEDVAAWVSSMVAEGRSPSIVAKAHRVLSLMLALAVRGRRLTTNPADDVRLPRMRKPDKRFLTHEQVAQLASAAGSDWEADEGLVIAGRAQDRVLVLVMAYCGLRWGEASALRVGRVDLMRRRLEVAEAVSEVNGALTWGTPKGHKRRSVPVPKFVADALTEVMVGKGVDDLVFTTPRGAVLRRSNWRRDVFDRAASAVDLEGLTPHELRHTAASLGVQAGANVKAVQRMLGHASAAMTLDVYSGLFDDDLDGVADRLDEQGNVYGSCTEGEVIPLRRAGDAR